MFEGTPLHQDTFELIRCQDRKDWRGAYTPHWISTWEHAPEDSGFDARNMFLHEFSHTLEIFIRRPKQRWRLLEKNYGFVQGQFTQASFDVEAWVLALQDLLCREVFGGPTLTEDVITRVRGSFAKKVDVPLEVFRAQLQDLGRAHAERGAAYYFAQWQAACAWVKAEREAEAPDLLFEMLGIRLG